MTVTGCLPLKQTACSLDKVMVPGRPLHDPYRDPFQPSESEWNIRVSFHELDCWILQYKCNDKMCCFNYRLQVLRDH